MRILGFEAWQVWTRVLQIVGGVALLVNNIWFWGLYAYYTSSYHVISKDNQIVLSPYAYKSPESVISMLKSRIQSGQSKPKTGEVPD